MNFIKLLLSIRREQQVVWHIYYFLLADMTPVACGCAQQVSTGSPVRPDSSLAKFEFPQALRWEPRQGDISVLDKTSFARLSKSFGHKKLTHLSTSPHCVLLLKPDPGITVRRHTPPHGRPLRARGCGAHPAQRKLQSKPGEQGKWRACKLRV